MLGSYKQHNTSSYNIGIFDSGIGGLSIMQYIEQYLPNEQLIYLADSLYAPYGNKSEQFIKQRVLAIGQWFIEKKVKAIVIACNTATVNAIDLLRKHIAIPIIGVEPAIKPAVNISKNKKIALLVTQATAHNQRFLTLVDRYKNNSDVYIQACPGLVELIERYPNDLSQCSSLLQYYLQPLMATGVDTLVLGCTHYPLVKAQIVNIVGNTMNILDTTKAVTEQLIRQLSAFHIINCTNDKIKHQLYSSDASITLQNKISTILNKKIILNELFLQNETPYTQ